MFSLVKWARKAGVTLCTFVLLSGFVVPTTAQRNRGFTEYTLDRAVVEVPFEYHQHQILVKGRIGDKKLTFLLDTGTTVLILSKTAGVKGEFDSKVQLKEAEGSSEADGIWLDKFQLGEEKGLLEITNFSALVTDLSQISQVTGKRIDGIIGMALLAGYLFEIDYAKKSIRFFPMRSFDVSERKPDNKKTFLLDLIPSSPDKRNRCLMVRGFLHDGYDYDFLLDSGFGGYLSISGAAAVESGLLTDRTPRVNASAFSLSRKFNTSKIRASYLKLGQLDLAGRVIQIDYRNNNEVGQFGILGNRFLQNYRVTMDTLRKKLWLERVTNEEEPDDSEQVSFGFTLRTRGVNLRVDTVTERSPAHKAGIRPGDAILSINGREVYNIASEELGRLLLTPKAEVTLSIMPGVDPNLGTQAAKVMVRLQPKSPFDWF